MIVSIIQVHANNIVFTLKIRLFIWNCYKLLVISPFIILFFLFLYDLFFFTFCVFLYINMDILNIDRGIKKISVNEIGDFIFEKYYERNGFSKESSYYLIQQLKKID